METIFKIVETFKVCLFGNPYFWVFQIISLALLIYLSGDGAKIVKLIKSKLK